MTVHSQLRQFGLFDARVPRYTSYPTAPQFSGGVGPAQTAAWLGTVAPGSEISVYIHIPFCRRLCWFCACRTQGTQTLSPVAGYVDTLKAEIGMVADALPDGVRIAHLHWGGGTPTLLSPELIGDLAGALAAQLPLTENAQFSVEIDPSEIDGERLDALIAAGMTRASIGVQDFQPEIQALIGREQSFEITRDTVEALRARGIGSVNIDMLYGLPRQDRPGISDTVQKVLSLSPDRVALYGYAHVPWMAKRQALIPTDILPTPEERLALFDTASQLFEWDGYQAIGIDHFARPQDSLARAARDGSLRRNFQGYTEDTAPVLVGLGASAISRLPQGYAQNHPATSAYQGAVRGGALATGRGHSFSADDILRGRIIEELMCQFRLDFAALGRELSVPTARIRDLARQAVGDMASALAITDAALTIRPEALPLARVIARRFDAYDMAQARHSQAI